MNQKKLLKASTLFYEALPLMKKLFMSSPSFAPGEISPFLYTPLLCVHFGGKMKMSVISEATGSSRPLVSQQVEKLVASGLMERSSDPQDRRSVEVSLTAKGRRFAQEIVTCYLEKGSALLAPLSDEDIDRFMESVTVLASILKKADAARNSAKQHGAHKEKQ
mgnify:CR=1 FL=1